MSFNSIDKTNGYLKRSIKLCLYGTSVSMLSNSFLVSAQQKSIEETKVTEEVEKISVVGSRIKKQTFESISPVTIVSAEMLIETGFTNLEEALAELPQLAIGTNIGNSSNGTTSSNLRGAGVQRTLTLINGKRAVASSIAGTQVDMSMIPIGMVKRVEVLTGGASAVYGSDALAGVINIVLNDEYEGLKLTSNTSLPQKGGAESQQLSLSMGGSFAGGRGNITAGFNYSNSKPLLQKDRDFVYGENYISSVSNPESATSTDGIPDYLIVNNLHTGSYPATGGLRTWNWDEGRYDHYYIDPSTGDMVFNDNQFYGQYTQGGPGFAFGEYSFQLRGQQDVFNAMVNLNYDFDDVALYSSFNIGRSSSKWLGQMAYTPNPIKVYRDNPTLPLTVQQYMDDKGWNEIVSDSSINRWDIVYRTHEDIGRQGNSTERTIFSGIVGFTGVISEWNWDLSIQHGESNMNQRQSRIYKDRHDFAFDVTTDADGEPVCRAVLEGNPSAAGCQPLAIFGVNENQEALNWIKATPQSMASNKQTIVSGFVSGSVFELPGGNANLVIGAEYRKETIESTPDAAEYAGNILLAGISPPIVPTSLDVNEAFIEFNAPVLASLELIGSYRFSDYSTIGNVNAWGLGLDYKFSEHYKFRASAAKSVRAPSVYDLFNPGTVGFAFITDPCNKPGEGDNPDIRTANCKIAVGDSWEDSLSTASRRVRSGGNPGLKPEQAETLSAGVVISPEQIENLNISIDWWKIDLENEITTVSVNQLLTSCYDTEGLTGSACQAITRRADGAITEIVGGSINLGYTELEGIDYEIDYRINGNKFVSSLDGDFFTNILINQWIARSSVSDPTKIEDSYYNYKGNYFYPDFTANLTLGYQAQDWQIKLRMSLRDKAVANSNFDHEKANYDEVYPNGNGEVSYIKRFDLYGNYAINKSANISFGIRNLTNEIPPRKTSLFGGQYGIADVIGRTFNVGFSYSL